MRKAGTSIIILLIAALAGSVLSGCDTDSVAQVPAEEGFVEIDDGARIHYRIQGEGQPMVLIHGYPLGGELYKRTQDELSDAYRVITLDLRGYDQSTAPDSQATIARYAMDVFAVMDALGVEQAVIGGPSMGGPIVFEMYQRQPDRFMRMLLIDTIAAPASPLEAHLWRGAAEQAREMGVAALVPPLINDMLTGDTRMTDPEVVNTIAGLFKDASLKAGIAGATALASRPDYRPVLEEITVPTLILVGLEDTVYPYEISRSMEQAIPTAELVILSDAAHASILEAADRASAAIEDWADGIGGSV